MHQNNCDRLIGTKMNNLEEKCRYFDCQCTEYLEELSRKNQELRKKIASDQKICKRIQESDQRFQRIFEYAPFGAAMTDCDGKILRANRAMCTMLGYSQREMQTRHFTQITHPDDRDTDLKLFAKLKSGEIEFYRIDKRYLAKDGKTVWGSLAVTLIQEAGSGEFTVIGMVEDISEKKKIEQQLKTSNNNLEIIVDKRTSEIRMLKDRLQAENRYLKQELASTHRYGTIIGQSESIKNVTSQIELVAPTNANVLIEGESGTGKELVAREIHKNSRRSTMAFVKVNCAAIPGDLYESEFFGHIKGAFTGAVKDRAGRFETAHGGTIFLDEVGDIPLSLQSKLLRVLQEGEYERLGDEKTRRVDVRVIAATNRDLKKEVEGGNFREDLYYRLNVFPLHVPSLSERIDDITLLASHFIKLFAEELKIEEPQLTLANLQDLQSYEWPGNVRELENMIERAMILAKSGKLDFSLLPGVEDKIPVLQYKSTPTLPSPGIILREEEINEFTTANMTRALQQCNWKIYGDDGASALLGIKPTTLIERMKRRGIEKPHNE